MDRLGDTFWLPPDCPEPPWFSAFPIRANHQAARYRRRLLARICRDRQRGALLATKAQSRNDRAAPSGAPGASSRRPSGRAA
jgi:hypothetical protein